MSIIRVSSSDGSLLGALWRVNIRRPAGDPKYIGPAGAANGLFNADKLRPGQPVALVEGEIDAMTL